MAKFISISFDGTDVKVINLFQIKQRMVIEALTAKMTQLMMRLQAKIRLKIEGGKYSTGRLASSVANPRTEIEGGLVTGRLDYGEGFEYAQAVEEGVSHPWVIYPKQYVIPGVMASKGKAAIRKQIVSKQALHFYSDRLGKNVFADYVFRSPTTGKFYVKNSIDEMQEEIVRGIQESLNEVISRR